MPKLTDEEVRGNMTEYWSLVWSGGDLKTRFRLIDIAEREYRSGNQHGCARLMHMCDYLSDRLRYELEPPPSKFHIRWLAAEVLNA